MRLSNCVILFSFSLGKECPKFAMTGNPKFKWDPRDYAENSAAQASWAKELIASTPFSGNEWVLDIGCGNGGITAELAKLLPLGRSIGIDSSAEMIDYARAAHPAHEFPNLDFICMDALAIDFQPGTFHLVFSNAALHWVEDHQTVLRAVGRVLQPGGKLVISCGGRGNAAEIIRTFEQLISEPAWKPYFETFAFPLFFHGPERYPEWLSGAGLAAERVELKPKDMLHRGEEGLAGWIRTTWMPYTERVPKNLQPEFVGEFVERYLRAHPLDSAGRAHVQMVRLEVVAVRRK